MGELNWAFGEYINEFRKLNVVDKRREILKSTKEMVAVFEELGRIDDVNLEHLHKKDVMGVTNIDDEDIFLETALIYLEDAKYLIGQYLDKKY